ncbi:MAG TPA: zinc ribbon domain-containing protein [Acidimicrobiales bacterium]|nr:zinc ribbon domain-containing protein [Acidimicrobiales bacterium]
MRATTRAELVDVEPEEPFLRVTRCRACGRVAFPPMTIGCDACGAGEEELAPVTVRAAGVLHASATVHRHHGEQAVPFTIVEVRLDAGPIVRAMGAPGGGGVRVGDRVAARWQVTGADGDGNELVEPVFEKESP